MTPEIQQVQDLSEQEQIRRAKLAKYQEEGRDPYTITRFDRTHTSAQILADFDALEGKTVRIAGRMMSRRIMGKATSSTCWTATARFRPMCAARTWARTYTRTSKPWTSAISSAWRA